MRFGKWRGMPLAMALAAVLGMGLGTASGRMAGICIHTIPGEVPAYDFTTGGPTSRRRSRTDITPRTMIGHSLADRDAPRMPGQLGGLFHHGVRRQGCGHGHGCGHGEGLRSRQRLWARLGGGNGCGFCAGNGLFGGHGRRLASAAPRPVRRPRRPAGSWRRSRPQEEFRPVPRLDGGGDRPVAAQPLRSWSLPRPSPCVAIRAAGWAARHSHLGNLKNKLRCHLCGGAAAAALAAAGRFGRSLRGLRRRGLLGKLGHGGCAAAAALLSGHGHGGNGCGHCGGKGCAHCLKGPGPARTACWLPAGHAPPQQGRLLRRPRRAGAPDPRICPLHRHDPIASRLFRLPADESQRSLTIIES